MPTTVANFMIMFVALFQGLGMPQQIIKQWLMKYSRNKTGYHSSPPSLQTNIPRGWFWSLLTSIFLSTGWRSAGRPFELRCGVKILVDAILHQTFKISKMEVLHLEAILGVGFPLHKPYPCAYIQVRIPLFWVPETFGEQKLKGTTPSNAMSGNSRPY